MTKQRIGVLVVCLLLAAVGVGADASRESGWLSEKKSGGAVRSVLVMPGSEQWMDIPAAALVGTPWVEMGGTVKIAVLQGDPMTAGRSYTLGFPARTGQRFAPHWHPTTENVTVIKGTFLLGIGAKWDDAAMKEIPVGGFSVRASANAALCPVQGGWRSSGEWDCAFCGEFRGPDDPGLAKKMN